MKKNWATFYHSLAQKPSVASPTTTTTTPFDLPLSPLHQRVPHIAFPNILRCSPFQMFLWFPISHPSLLRIQATFLLPPLPFRIPLPSFQTLPLLWRYFWLQIHFPFPTSTPRHDLALFWVPIVLFGRCHTTPRIRDSFELGLTTNTLVSHANLYSYDA